MFPRPVESAATSVQQATELSMDPAHASAQAEALVGIDDVQKSLNRSRASVYRYTNTDPRNLNPPFNPRKLNPEYRSDQKDPLWNISGSFWSLRYSGFNLRGLNGGLRLRGSVLV